MFQNNFNKEFSTMRRRFDVVSFLVGVSVLMVFVGFGSTCVANGSGWHKERAERNAQQFLDELHLEHTGVSCVRNDTDGDGYVSCTVALSSHETLALECAGFNLFSIFQNEGCREQKIMNRLQ